VRSGRNNRNNQNICIINEQQLVNNLISLLVVGIGIKYVNTSLP
jgi:hypothetical protein